MTKARSDMWSEEADLKEFRAGLSTSTSASNLTSEEIDDQEEKDPDIPDALVLEGKSPFASSSLTVALQLLPEDGSATGRQVILVVKSDQVAQPLKLVRLEELGPLPPLLEQMLQQLELQINSYKPAEIKKGTEKESTPVTSVTNPNNQTVSKRNGKKAAVVSNDPAKYGDNTTLPVIRPGTSGSGLATATATYPPSSISNLNLNQTESLENTSPETTRSITGELEVSPNSPRQSSMFELL